MKLTYFYYSAIFYCCHRRCSPDWLELSLYTRTEIRGLPRQLPSTNKMGFLFQDSHSRAPPPHHWQRGACCDVFANALFRETLNIINKPIQILITISPPTQMYIFVQPTFYIKLNFTRVTVHHHHIHPPIDQWMCIYGVPVGQVQCKTITITWSNNIACLLI